MKNEVLLAVIQAATEFLPISSSGHLALLSNLIDEPNLFLITTLHMASLIAVLIFTRKEIISLIKFEKPYRRLWLYLIIATIPAALFGLFFKNLIEQAFSSFLFLGLAFIFTGSILLTTKLKKPKSKLNSKKALTIGLFQTLALFPGISRSGMTISSSLLMGMTKEKAAKFSFLLFIPLSLGAILTEVGEFYISTSLIIAFILCTILSILFLNILLIIIKKEKFWLFSFYCFAIGIISLILHFT